MIRHHPEPEILFDYAAGALPEGVSLAVATHLALCRACRMEVEAWEAVGGVLIEMAEPVPMSAGAVDATLGRLDEVATQRVLEVDQASSSAVNEDGKLPSPLRPYLGLALSELTWRRIGRALEEIRIPLALPGIKASLLRMRAGSPVPRHGHRGLEYTVVLAGGYRDGSETFSRGDFVVVDAASEHQPIVADEHDECLALVILEAPIKLSGPLGWVVNPFLKS